VVRTKEALLMTQERYALDILQQVNMTSCNAASTPMVPGEKLLVSNGELLGPRDATQYQSVVGALQYLTLTQPDLSFAVCQFLHNPWCTGSELKEY
jgi:hypothetical protein